VFKILTFVYKTDDKGIGFHKFVIAFVEQQYNGVEQQFFVQSCSGHDGRATEHFAEAHGAYRYRFGRRFHDARSTVGRYDRKTVYVFRRRTLRTNVDQSVASRFAVIAIVLALITKLHGRRGTRERFDDIVFFFFKFETRKRKL